MPEEKATTEVEDANPAEPTQPDGTKLGSDMMFHIRSLSRIIYYVTDEEDRFLKQFRTSMAKHTPRTWVFNPCQGLLALDEQVKDWSTRAHAVNTDQADIHSTLERIYRDDPREALHCYIILDPERYLGDPHVQRRIINIINQIHNDIKVVKLIVFVGTRRFVPEKLARFIEVVEDKGLLPKEIENLVDRAMQHLKMAKEDTPPNAPQLFKGMTSFEVNAAIAQSIVRTRKEDPPKRIEPKYVADYRRHALKKTDLLQNVDTSQFNFDIVGGAERFKQWAARTACTWTEEGRKFGLRPPKGVLAVGVWGCGKSLSIKAMGQAWNKPVIQFEMGRLRSAVVGEAEGNIYRALNLIEKVAPCIVWIDEAEKSLAGAQSSAFSDSGIMARSIGIMSTWLQETHAHVCLAMTANSLATLPVEFINRMDERFYFEMPSEEDRIEILKIHLKKAGQNTDLFDLKMLAEKADLMVGREIEQAIGAAMTESFNQKKSGLDQDILAAEFSKKPRIAKTMVDEIKTITDWVGFDDDIQDGIRARYASPPRNRDKSSTAKLLRGV